MVNPVGGYFPEAGKALGDLWELTMENQRFQEKLVWQPRGAKAAQREEKGQFTIVNIDIL